MARHDELVGTGGGLRAVHRGQLFDVREVISKLGAGRALRVTIGCKRLRAELDLADGGEEAIVAELHDERAVRVDEDGAEGKVEGQIMTLRPIFAVAMALGLSACSLGGAVRSQASRDFSCPEGQVEAVEVSDYLTRATGCGKQALYNRAAESPLRRASFDLACPAEQLRMVALGDNSIGVEGCGKKASYAWVDQAWVGH